MVLSCVVPDSRSYTTRINRVLDHVDAHLSDKLDLASLARVAHVSDWHFHRVFHAFIGETPSDWVRRRRLEVAAMRLLTQRRAPILRIALEVGFRSGEVFTRAFAAHFGVTPSAWRRGAAQTWAAKRQRELSKIHQEDRKRHQAAARDWLQHPEAWPHPAVALPSELTMSVELRTLPSTRVAYLRYLGPYGTSGITRTWQRFSAVCAAQGLVDRVRFGVARDQPGLTAAARLRYDACVEVEGSFVPAPDGEVGVQTIAGGLYACARFCGRALEIHRDWAHLFTSWLPASRYELDDRPALERYGTDSELNPKTGVFTCELCLPVRSA